MMLEENVKVYKRKAKDITKAIAVDEVYQYLSFYIYQKGYTNLLIIFTWKITINKQTANSMILQGKSGIRICLNAEHI